MASFGGETPVGQTSITSSSLATSGTKYTVPSGRYARLSGFFFISSSGGSPATMSIGGYDFGNGSYGTSGQPVNFTVILTSGQTVVFQRPSGGGTQIEAKAQIGIVEFNNP